MKQLLKYTGWLGLPPDAWLLVVDVDRQQLRLLSGSCLVRIYPVSTSRFGTGGRADSRQTPTGWHEVADRIGRDAPLGQPFVSREPAGPPLPEADWRNQDATDRILTRILRLRGLEPGLNAGPGVDSYDRYIYLHGTNQEHRLGDPASQGCIRLANRDIAQLTDTLADAPAWCWIGELADDTPLAERIG